MNSQTITQAIKSKLYNQGLSVTSGSQEIIDMKLNQFPCAIIKEINSSIDNIQNNSYQILSYEILILAKEKKSDSDSFNSEKLKTILFDLLKELLEHDIVTQVNLKSLKTQKAKYTIHNEISAKAEFNIKTIYSLI